MTDDDLKRLRFQARTMAAQLMIAHAQNLPAEVLGEFAAGLVEGVRDTLTAYGSEKVAYDVIQAVADAAAVPVCRDAQVPL